MKRRAVEVGAEPERTVLHEKKRREILAGAAEVFYRRGFSAGTTKEIAAQVGLTQPAIYHYVGSKDDLLREIALQVDRDLMHALDLGLARSDDDPRLQLEGVIEEFVAAVLSNRETFAVYWKELHSLPEDIRRQVQRHERQFVASIGRLVEALQTKGTLPADAETIVVTEGIVGMVCWLYHWYRPGRSLDARSVARVFCQMLGLRGTTNGESTT